jgi:type I restriction enzyme S subunit
MATQAAAKVKAVDGPGELPAGWKWVSLGELCSDIVGGGTPKRNVQGYFGGEIVWITPSDLDTNTPSQEICSSRNTLTSLGLQSSAAKLVPPGTILFSSRATIGKIAIAGVPLCTNQGFVNLICGDNLDNRYLAWSLRLLTNEIKKLGGSTTYLEVSRRNLRQFKIPVPFHDFPARSLETQHRIVARIEALLAEVKRAREILEQMRREAALVMDSALQELVNRLPQTRRTLIEVIESKPRNGWSPKCDNDPKGIPVLKLGAVLSFRYKPDEFKRTSVPVDHNAHYWLQPDDILISRSNTLDLVGHASIYTGRPSPCIYPYLLMRIRVNTSEANRKFLIYWLSTNEVRSYIKSRASGASPTMKKIKQDDVCNIPFPVIDIDEQKHWASHLDSIQSSVDELTESLEQDEKLLDQLEQSILERAFRGNL